MEYKYTEKCREISGFGSSYEQGCRDMVVAGMKWFDKNPKAKPIIKEYKNVYGLIDNSEPQAKQLVEAMTKDCDDCTGAMVQASVNHVLFAHANGWSKYIKDMESVK